MKLFKNMKKYKAEIIVGLGALLAGVFSFFITVSVYPSIKSNEIKYNNISVADGVNIEDNDNSLQIAQNNVQDTNKTTINNDMNEEILNNNKEQSTNDKMNTSEKSDDTNVIEISDIIEDTTKLEAIDKTVENIESSITGEE